MAIAENEIVTSPTLNPTKAARSEDNRSADSMPQGASASMPAIRIRITRAKPVASTPICASDRRWGGRVARAGGEHPGLGNRPAAGAGVGLQRRPAPALVAQSAADELVGGGYGEQQQRE